MNRVIYDGGALERQTRQQFNMHMRQEFGDLDNGAIVEYNGTLYIVTNNYDAGGQSNPIFNKMSVAQIKHAKKYGRIP